MGCAYCQILKSYGIFTGIYISTSKIFKNNLKSFRVLSINTFIAVVRRWINRTFWISFVDLRSWEYLVSEKSNGKFVLATFKLFTRNLRQSKWSLNQWSSIGSFLRLKTLVPKQKRYLYEKFYSFLGNLHTWNGCTSSCRCN